MMQMTAKESICRIIEFYFTPKGVTPLLHSHVIKCTLNDYKVDKLSEKFYVYNVNTSHGIVRE